MALVPETKWTNIVTKVGNLRGGKRWYTDFQYVGVTNEYIQFPHMVTLDTSNFNESVSVDYSTAFTTEPIITFKNGSKLCIKCWMMAAHDGLAAHPTGEVVLINGTQVERNLGLCPGWIGGGVQWGTNLAAFKAEGIKCVLLLN